MPHLKYRLEGHQTSRHMLGKYHGQLNCHTIKRPAVPQIAHRGKISRKGGNIRNRRHQKFIIEQTVPPLGHLVYGNPIIGKNKTAVNKKRQEKQKNGGCTF